MPPSGMAAAVRSIVSHCHRRHDQGRIVEAAAPWDSYSRAPLWAGFTHAVGRDAVEHALRDAGAVLGDLSFGPPGPEYVQSGRDTVMVFDVYWVGDGRRTQYDGQPRHSRVLMRWRAVPSALRGALVDELVHRWLPPACEWAAAPTRANVWSAIDHQWMVVLRGTTLALVEDDRPTAD